MTTLRDDTPHVFAFPDDLKILECIDTACWLMDFNPENTRHIWCNSSCLSLLGKTRIEFLSTDLTSNRTAARIQEQRMMYDKIQVELEQVHHTYAIKRTYIHFISLDCVVHTNFLQIQREAASQRRTIYPKGKAVTMDVLLKPLRISSSAENYEKTVCLIQATPVTAPAEADRSCTIQMQSFTPSAARPF